MRRLILLICTVCCSTLAEDTFEIPDFKANWHQAHGYCLSQGMSLVTVDSLAKHEQLVSFLETSDKFNNITSRFWIGANDLGEEGKFVWVATGDAITWRKWTSGEPNNDADNEHCVELIYCPACPRIWEWNDNECREFKSYFVCEMVERNCLFNVRFSRTE